MLDIEIIKGNIVNCDTEAIVNAANEHLRAGGGVCGAIFEAAGHTKMQEACNKIGHCDTGNAVITDGFNLKSRYVIHAVGPKYGDCCRKHNDDVKRTGLEELNINDKITNRELYDAYINSLKLGEKYNIKSISFPIISAGIYGYPLDLAIKIELCAIMDYQNEFPNTSLEKVIICAFSSDMYDKLIEEYGKLKRCMA